MDAELMTIFSNINSLVDQAKQMLGGQKAQMAEMEPEEKEEMASPEVAEKIMKFLKEMDEPEEKEEKPGEVEKADQPKLSTPDEGVTATDGATAIVDETTPEQEKNLNEIARALITMMANKSQNKSVKKSNDNKELYSFLQNLVDEQKEVKKAIKTIYEGLGVAEQIKKTNEVQKSENVRRPLNDPDEIQKSLDYIKQQLGVQSHRPVGNDGDSIHKSLSDALSNIAPNVTQWGR